MITNETVKQVLTGALAQKIALCDTKLWKLQTKPNRTVKQVLTGALAQSIKLFLKTIPGHFSSFDHFSW